MRWPSVRVSVTRPVQRPSESGGARYEQQMGWVLSHLGKARWVDRPERGRYRIDDAGRAALSKYSGGFDYALAGGVFAPFWPEKGKPNQAKDGTGASLR